MIEKYRRASSLAVAAAIAMAMLAAACPSLAAPSPRLARIAASGLLHVCIWPEYYGISYHNPKSNSITGLDAELAGELARELRAKLAFVESSFAKLIGDLFGDRCDIAMMAVAITPDRAARVAFSRPYLRTDVYMVTTRNSPRIRTWEDMDRSGVRIGVAAGTYHEKLMRERLEHSQLVVIDTPQTREGELEAGRIDAFMSDFPFTRKMADYHDWVRVIAPNMPYFPVLAAYAAKPGDDEWLAYINRFVAAIKADGRLARIAARYGLEPIVLRE